ncbi:MAG: tRNA pseudouridine(54/55) synthase Pus10, partial [Promethearchaeota archaeon]
MTINLEDAEISKISKKTLLNYKLCNHCLGRIFAKVETGLTNEKRGQLIRKQIKNKEKIQVKNCWLCNGLMGEISHFVNLIEDVLKDYQYETFLVGSKVDEDIIEREKELLEYTKTDFSESIKTELNREIGKILEKNLNKEVDFEKPTIMAVIDTAFDDVNLQISSIFYYGRYKKYKRNIPQTRWFCKICHGKGCKRCNYSGKLYDTSVEELIARDFLEMTKGEDESFHGCGREDVDVRMLGNGRPFILEIKNPKIRNFNLDKIENKINSENKKKIEINELRLSNKEEVIKLKDAGFRKVYRVLFSMEKPINNEKLKKAALSLRGKSIGQLTPSRVVHRRADMIREKQIYSCIIQSIDGTMATLTLATESGTYIKELISGDNGRTKPNIS